MKNDSQIKEKVKQIHQKSGNYLDFVNTMNECAFTDRMIEEIIDDAKELEQLHGGQFNQDGGADE